MTKTLSIRKKMDAIKERNNKITDEILLDLSIEELDSFYESAVQNLQTEKRLRALAEPVPQRIK